MRKRPGSPSKSDRRVTRQSEKPILDLLEDIHFYWDMPLRFGGLFAEEASITFSDSDFFWLFLMPLHIKVRIKLFLENPGGILELC